MKILWFGHFIPYPPIGGAHQRSCNLVRHLAMRHDVHVVAFNFHRDSPATLAECERVLRTYCASVEFWEMPLAWKSPRWWLELLYSPLLRAPFSCHAFWSAELESKLIQRLERLPDAVVHFDSIDLGFFVEAIKGHPRVLNHHNCESAMAFRRADKEGNFLKKLYLRLQARKLEALEDELCPRVEMNTVVSAEDWAALARGNDAVRTRVVANGTDTEFFQPSTAEPEAHSIIFSSSFNWYPNVSAIRFFRERIWPLVKRECREARWYLAGQSPPGWLLRWPQEDASITVVPNPPDMRPWMAQAAVFVCPIVDGGGTRLKILDAMASGKAVVSTSIGCEGLKVRNGEDILVADDPQAFAAAVVRMLSDAGLRRKISTAGRTLIEREYGWGSIARDLEEAYDKATAESRAVVGDA